MYRRLIQVVRINNVFLGGFCLLGTCIFKNHSTLLQTLFLTKIEDCVRSDINMVFLFLVLCWISSTNMFCIECIRLPWLRREKYPDKYTTPLPFLVCQEFSGGNLIVIDTQKCSSFPLNIQFLFILKSFWWKSAHWNQVEWFLFRYQRIQQTQCTHIWQKTSS